MAEVLETSQEAIDTCLMYESLQKKTKSEVFRSVLKTLGGADTLKEFEDTVGKMDENEQYSYFQKKKNLLSIRNDKTAIHFCVLYEFVQKKPIGQAYKSISGILGKDVIDFKDFKILFDNFENGDYKAVEKQGNESPESDNESHPTHSDKPIEFAEKIYRSTALGKMVPATFSDMSVKITEKIVENLDLMDRLILRKVNKKLRGIVDSTELFCDKIDVSFQDRHTRIRIGSNPPIEYHYKGIDKCSIDFNKKHTILNGIYHAESALNDLSTFIENPKLELGTLKVNYCLGVALLYDIVLPHFEMPQTRIQAVEELFKSLRSPLHVETFGIEFEIYGEYTKPVMSILPYLKPGTLEKIKVRFNSEICGMSKQVLELEQWKRAKCEWGV